MVPAHLECSYCKRNSSHGGECIERTRSKGCLFFSLDSRGCIRNSNFKFSVKFTEELPLIGIWDSKYQVFGVDSEMKINEIYSLNWDMTKGTLIIHCNADYYVNEFHKDFTEVDKKLKFKIIK